MEHTEHTERMAHAEHSQQAGHIEITEIPVKIAKAGSKSTCQSRG